MLYETHEYEKIPDTYTTMENKYGKNSYFNNIDFIEQDYPKMYYEWGKYLWDNDNFSDANKKFHKILGTYDQSTYAYEAQTDIQNLYLDWATYLADHQDYENAFAHLDDIQSKWPLSQASDLSNDLYFEIGFKYAKELHNDSKFEEEVEIIENLIKKFPLSSQIDVLYETQQAAYIAYANQKLANDQFFDAISFLELAKKYASDEETIEGINERISEANHAILFDQGEEGKLIIKSIISAVCNTGAELPEIVNLIPNDASKIALCGYSTYKPDPDSLADSLGEMKYIVDINDETKTIENCPYEGMNNLIRRQKYIEIVIYDAKSGKRIKSHTVFGKMPEQCPDFYTFTHDQFSILGVTDSLYGADVDKQDVDDWLTGYLPK